PPHPRGGPILVTEVHVLLAVAHVGKLGGHFRERVGRETKASQRIERTYDHPELLREALAHDGFGHGIVLGGGGGTVIEGYPHVVSRLQRFDVVEGRAGRAGRGDGKPDRPDDRGADAEQY